jgi:hypothetical protein
MATIIKVSEIKKAPRGRQPNIREDLLKVFKQVKPGQAVVLDEEFGNVSKEDRSKVQQIVRTHWERVHDTKPSINFSEDGVMQVSHRAAKSE